jgi:hypothetical protein
MVGAEGLSAHKLFEGPVALASNVCPSSLRARAVSKLVVDADIHLLTARWMAGLRVRAQMTRVLYLVQAIPSQGKSQLLAKPISSQGGPAWSRLAIEKAWPQAFLINRV